MIATRAARLIVLAGAAVLCWSLRPAPSVAQQPPPRRPSQDPGQTPGPGRGRAARGPSKPTPRHAGGRVNLGAPAGESGFWGGGGSIVGRRGSSLPANPEVSGVPFQPWSKALYDARLKQGEKDDPHARCLPPGGPRQFQTPNGFEFIEQPERKRITIIFGGGPRSWRFIYLDGRPLPRLDDPDLIPTYFGYSTGRWDGDTLVVESTGYNEKFWFLRGGLPHTDALHLTERFSRPDFDTLKYEVTVDDPKAYTRPWTGGFTVPWTYTNWDGSPGGEIHEYFCQDNERDYSRLR
jgi:hypothetical protein